MSQIHHALVTSGLGIVQIVVPSSWPADYGFVIKVGSITKQPLVRVQSRCAYGEVFGSIHCDCAEQLAASCSLIKTEGGLIFYLEQEGRGAGGTVKARAYMAFEQNGIDTFRFYESLGLPADLRDYTPVADALKEFGIESVRLITNDPSKMEALASRGIATSRVELALKSNGMNEAYMAAKRSRGQLL